MDVFGVRRDTSTAVDAAVRAYVNQQAENVKKKNDTEIDLLTKIRNYSLKRGAIEHEYGQALQSLRQQFSMDERQYKDLGFSNRSLYGAWNSYLEEIKRLGTQHVSLSQFYAQNIGNNLKNVHTSKMDTVKKRTEELKKCTQELVSSSAYTEKYRKAYVEAFGAFATATAKCRSKGPIKNERKESLEKARLKSSELEKAAIDARNLYIIRLEATRTHRNWFANTVVPKLIQETEGHVYESLWTYLSVAACIELENYESACRDFKTLSVDMEKIPSADEHRQQFLGTVEPVSPAQSLQFEPCPSDTVLDLRRSCANDPTLASEAKTWTSSYIRAQKAIDEASYKLAQLEKMARYVDDLKTPAHTRSGPSEVLKSVEETKDTIRRAEINKLKAEAILDKLRAAGISVDEPILVARAESLSTYSSYGSQRSSSHMSLASVSEPASDDTSTGSTSTPCIALYNYEPKSQDELRITAGEILTILDNLDDNQWPRAKNKHGHFGIVPCNYIKPIVQEESAYHKLVLPPLPPKLEKSILRPAKSFANLSREEGGVAPLFHCRAKYKYTGRDSEELSFNAGDILAVIDEAPHDVLDGWWKGSVVEGKALKGTAGTFPSMLVEKASFEESDKTGRTVSAASVLTSNSNVALRRTSTKTADRRSLKTWYGSDAAEQTAEAVTEGVSTTFSDQWRLPSRPWKSRLQLNGNDDH